ncbi:hypothetical protein CROQUDRAFT_52380 [Cronartium quercuum f. sp. fusiforme G11]|uniref:PX domain-containing protein n=1 Tax=Cronartium quercuum f. sp. fusiforme G11 TaxID=708437 RepID=A0A9P6T6X0_9BASI|nr:hypothetical protein CROQUDRAFT_52380 [Cronartium quercuum f. sp. fusiforme G11]
MSSSSTSNETNHIKSIQTSSIPLQPIFNTSSTPKPNLNQIKTTTKKQIPPPPPSSSSALTPLRAHYLKRELVTLQFATELETLSTPHALSLLGPPFLPSNQFTSQGLPISKPHDYHHHHHQKQVKDDEIDLPFLRYFFNKFIISFPFLKLAKKEFYSHKLQPFYYSFLIRNITSSELREEETKRKKISNKVEKHLGLVLSAAIKLKDNEGSEEVIRVINHNQLEEHSQPNDDDAFVPTPIIEKENQNEQNHHHHHHPDSNFDVNIVGIRIIKQKNRIRHKAHEEFLIRTKIPGNDQDDIYVSRRYGDFIKLAQDLRVELPDVEIRGPPAKDRRSVDGPTTNSPPESPNSTLTNHQPIHFTREKNRLTLRAYLHRLLSKPQIINSSSLRSFLIERPIKLNQKEIEDIENRLKMDQARQIEHEKFKLEVEGRVKELDNYLRGFREELVKSDGLSRVFKTIREIDCIDHLPIEYRKVIEWARISLASTIYQIFLGSDNSSAAFASLKRMHGLMPYWAMRGVLKVSNPVAMIRGIIDLFLARPFGASSLIQRMFTSGLYEEIRELNEDAEKVASKIGDSRMCDRVKKFIEAPREIQEVYESDAKSESIDIIAIILSSIEGPSFDPITLQRISRATKAYEEYKTERDNLEDPELNQGPNNDNAWLFEDLHVYLRLLRRARDKQQLIELIFEGTTSELLKDIVTIFYSPLMQVYKAANISDSLGDLQKFIDDLIKTVERAEEFPFGDPQRIVQTFVDLVSRHEGDFYKFVHQVHSKGSGLFDGLMNWIESLVNFVREGLNEKISLETLLPHSETMERIEIMKEIDLVIEYHRKLKVAHYQRMTKRLARNENQEDQVGNSDTAFVEGVMDNLNLSKVVGGDVEEARVEEGEEEDDDDETDSENYNSDEEEEEDDDDEKNSNKHKHNNNKAKGKGKSKFKDRVLIEPPQLSLIPTLVPLFTELVQQLL